MVASRLILPALVVLVAAGLLVAVLPSSPPSSAYEAAPQGMAHAAGPQKGVLDAGDVALLEAVPNGSHLRPAFGSGPAPVVAGDRGDVAPVSLAHGTLLHRLLVYVVYVPASDAYDVPALNLTNVTAFTLPNVGHLDASSGRYVHGPLLVRLDPATAGRTSGYVTKGDRWGLADQDARQAQPAALLTSASVHERLALVVDAQGIFAELIGALALATALAVGGPVLLTKLRRVRTRAQCTACEGDLRGHEPFCPRCGAHVHGRDEHALR